MLKHKDSQDEAEDEGCDTQDRLNTKPYRSCPASLCTSLPFRVVNV